MENETIEQARERQRAKNWDELCERLGFVPGVVPCGDCVRCCLGDAVRLLPQDAGKQLRTEPHIYRPGALMIAHKADGSCCYLGENGCTIHERKPEMCRQMDCRLIANDMSFSEARRLDHAGRLRLPVWKRGRELLKQIRGAKAHG